MTQPTGQPGAPGQPPQGVPPPSWQQPPQQPVPVVPPPPPPSWTANLTSTAPVAGPAGYVYGDVPNRAIAYIIDYVAMAIIGLLLAALTLGVLGSRVTNGPQEATVISSLVASLLTYAVIAVYFWYTWTKMRGTIGMRLLSMQIGNETDGQTLTNNQAMIRIVAMFGPGFVASILAAFVLSLAVIASLVAFVWFLALLYTTAKSPTKQGLHDQYAHTMVVKAARRAS
ncbi:MAG: RDD family protein [Chloroflexi bacterium]|nr:RDD family protein [Chloroflexota bacterium]